MASIPITVWAPIVAAVAAILGLLYQRRNFEESMRPELVLAEWSRRTEGQGGSMREVFSYKNLRNVGRGNAFNLVIECHQKTANRLTYAQTTTRIPVLESNGEIELNGEIAVWWKNVDPDPQGHKHLEIVLSIDFSDARGVRRRTKYSVFAVDAPTESFVVDAIAPGLGLVQRTTVTRSRLVPKFKLGSRIRRSLKLRSFRPKSRIE